MKELRNTACTQTGDLETVEVVYAIPPGSTEEFKAGVTAAAGLIGVRIQQFVVEPVAAALGYDLGQGEDTSDHTAVVFDLGGTKATASVVQVRNGTPLLARHISTFHAGSHIFVFMGWFRFTGVFPPYACRTLL